MARQQMTSTETAAARSSMDREGLGGDDTTFREIFDNTLQGICSLGPDQRIVRANRALAQLAGFDAGEELVGMALSEILAEDLQAVIPPLREPAEPGVLVTRDGNLVRRDGQHVYVLFRASRLPGGGDDFATVADLTDWKRAQDERDQARRDLARGERRYRQMVETSEEGIVTIDLDRIVTFANPRLAEMLGTTVDELVGSASAMFQTNQTPRLASEIKRFQRELEMLRADGSLLHALVKMNPLMNDDGDLIGHLAMLTDLTERKVYEDQLEFRAHHDALTGLPNRLLVMERLAGALARTTTRGSNVAVIFFDLDGFKEINSKYGHAGGDELLTCVGQRLAATTRPTDTVGRFGGDEFIVLAEGTGDFALHLADRLRAAIDVPCAIGASTVRIGASMGITVSHHDADPSSMLRDADLALLHAKAAGRGRTEVFSVALREVAEQRATVTSDLQSALERGELSLHFQPVVRLDDHSIVGTEALLRWHHPERGTLLPGEFLTVAEETGLIIPIGQWVLEEACRRLAEWHTIDPDLEVSVNVSARQLAVPEFIGMVRDTVAAAGVDPTRLVLELTESALTPDIDRCVADLTALRALGLTISLDDFGTGYSSLSHLKRLPVDTLKIDQTFVAGLPADSRDTALLRAMLAMAGALGLAVVAEGVENAAQGAALLALGCPLGQGYHYGYPVDAGTFTTLLHQVPVRPR